MTKAKKNWAHPHVSRKEKKKRNEQRSLDALAAAARQTPEQVQRALRQSVANSLLFPFLLKNQEAQMLLVFLMILLTDEEFKKLPTFLAELHLEALQCIQLGIYTPEGLLEHLREFINLSELMKVRLINAQYIETLFKLPKPIIRYRFGDPMYDHVSTLRGMEINFNDGLDQLNNSLKLIGLLGLAPPKPWYNKYIPNVPQFCKKVYAGLHFFSDAKAAQARLDEAVINCPARIGL